MQIKRHAYTIDWGHLLFVTLLGASVIWYLLDARAVSLKVNNLLLVQPVAIFALIMCALILPQCFRRVDGEVAGGGAEPVKDDPLAPALPTETTALIKMGVVGGALGALVFTMNTIGFDIAIWLFCVTVMLACGERRPLPLIVYPVAVAAVLLFGFRALMPYPMLTTIL